MRESVTKFKLKEILACSFYNLVNAALLVLVFREATMRRGDGPGGFGEMILKGFMLQPSVVLFFACLFISFKECFSAKSVFRLRVLYVVTTSLLLLFAAVSVVEACSDNLGHCRQWHIF